MYANSVSSNIPQCLSHSCPCLSQPIKPGCGQDFAAKLRNISSHITLKYFQWTGPVLGQSVRLLNLQFYSASQDTVLYYNVLYELNAVKIKFYELQVTMCILYYPRNPRKCLVFYLQLIHHLVSIILDYSSLSGSISPPLAPHHH